MSNLITFPLLALACFALPGYLLIQLLLPKWNGFARITGALLAGPILMGVLTTATALVTNSAVSLTEFLGLGILTVVGLGFALGRQRKTRPLSYCEDDGKLLSTTAAVFFFFLLHYDRDLFQFNCVNEAARLLLETGREIAENDYLLAGNTNVRMGNVALVSPFFLSFKFFGPRLLYAWTGALIAALGILVGRQLFNRNGWAITTGLILALNPLVTAIPILDENLFAYLLSLGILHLLLDEETPSPIWLGLLLAMLLGVRHLSLILTPAIGLALFQRKEHLGGRFWVLFAGSLVLVCSLWATHHQMAFGELFAFESFASYKPVHPHSFLGFDFDFQLLNYPFHDHVIRTPYNPYPNFLAMPLWILDRLGLIGSALIFVGFSALRKKAFSLSFMLLYCLPTFLILASLENWMQPNKMGIQLMVLPLVCIALAAGLHALLVQRTKTIIVQAIVLSSLFAVAQMSVAGIQFEADKRAYTLESKVRIEHAEYLSWEQKHLVKHNLLPNLTRIWEYTPFDPLRKLRDMAWDLTQSHSIGAPARAINKNAQSHTLRIDVRKGSPLYNPEWLSHDLDSTNTREFTQLTPQTKGAIYKVIDGVSWSELPLMIGLRTNLVKAQVELIYEFGERGLLDEFSTSPVQT
ncbi:MAG TPA: hypothetical protein EYN06_07425, partial [Myxococcales bacterium]|nr:hypothetical protein [Myxococcales bacterium]